MTKIAIYRKSDVCLICLNNKDVIVIMSNLWFLAVVEGMCSFASEELASEIIIETVLDVLTKKRYSKHGKEVIAFSAKKSLVFLAG